MLLAEHTTRRREALVRGDGVSQPMLRGAQVEKHRRREHVLRGDVSCAPREALIVEKMILC